jgi:hypothetical protein
MFFVQCAGRHEVNAVLTETMNGRVRPVFGPGPFDLNHDLERRRSKASIGLAAMDSRAWQWDWPQ